MGMKIYSNTYIHTAINAYIYTSCLSVLCLDGYIYIMSLCVKPRWPYPSYCSIRYDSMASVQSVVLSVVPLVPSSCMSRRALPPQAAHITLPCMHTCQNVTHACSIIIYACCLIIHASSCQHLSVHSAFSAPH